MKEGSKPERDECIGNEQGFWKKGGKRDLEKRIDNRYTKILVVGTSEEDIEKALALCWEV